jgi:hypothetical protein
MKYNQNVLAKPSVPFQKPSPFDEVSLLLFDADLPPKYLSITSFSAFFLLTLY